MLFSILMAETSRCYAVASYSTKSNPIIKLVRKFLPALIRILYSKTEQGWGGGAEVWGFISRGLRLSAQYRDNLEPPT